ncbi:MAG: tRNA (adenosine(37)-N6)-threonylcarbamoyltransferase complex transferase subunit TsaD [Candidatus Wildermuthbacteria bacterium]|nr:tRNA (adenosine(37)-N6)-threonylcarbamoyltransferase complex transferase subunit TsaD [Candidatus Wildermuthbacteria bacterium]
MLNHMRILSIETSCDETAIAVVEAKGRKPVFQVLSHIVASQAKLHAKYGGVYPTLAKRQHQINLPLALAKAIKKAGSQKTWRPLDAIALTVGPGLDPCLWTGIEFAKSLAKQWNVPIIPVNHIEGHLIISLMENKESKFQIPNAKTTFPAIALIVSGGHTQLILVKNIGKYKILGETRDDAAGECFDKAARILGLGYPGGPVIAKLADMPRPRLGNPRRGLGINLPRPMIYTKDYDFSFSGLKTAVLYDCQSRSLKVRKSKEYIQAMAKEIQQAVIDVLVAKTKRAAEDLEAKSIILGGGVAANTELRKQLAHKTRYPVLVAKKELCTDNGLMIALAGYFNRKKKTKKYERIVSKPNLTI